ncbi:hypothetical protein HY641_02520 [Candidatus Woesearchaeota archaeon]|nr:hypothetical protein [Candidatus Woesearchaeota archaeon]
MPADVVPPWASPYGGGSEKSSWKWILVLAALLLIGVGVYYGFPLEWIMVSGGVLVGVLFFVDASYGFLAVAIYAHTFDALTLFDRSRGGGTAIILYTMVAAAALIVYGWGNRGRNAGLFATLSVVSFLLPAIKGVLSRILPLTLSVYVDGVIVFAPIWVIFILMTDQRLRQAASLYFTFWLVIFSINFTYVSQTQGIGDIARLGLTAELIDVYQPIREVYQRTITAIKLLWTRMMTSFKGIEETIGTGFETQIQEAIHGEQEKPKAFVGLDIIGITTLEGERILAGEPLTLSADVKAGVLDQEIAANFACNAKPDGQDKTPIKADQITPQESLTVYSEWLEPVDCLFENLPAGDYEIGLAAEYGFTTKGEFSSYAVGINLWNALIVRARKEGGNAKDLFLKTQGLSPLGPSISTAGPVLVALDTGRDLLTIDPNNPADIILKVTVRNLWAGMISDLQFLTIIVPKGFDVKDVAGKDPKEPVQQTRCGDLTQQRQVLGACDDEKHNVFIAQLRKEAVGSIRNVRVYLSPTNPDDILRAGLYSIQTFKVIADYTYKVERATHVSVREQ